MTKHYVPAAQIFPNLAWVCKISNGTSFLLHPTSNSQWILNEEFQEKFQFESYLNFKGV
jgi:hypothetical protein